MDTPAPKTRRRSKAESSVKQAAEGLDLLELAGMPFSLKLRVVQSPDGNFDNLHTLG